MVADFTADWLSRFYPNIQQCENQGDLLLTHRLTSSVMQVLQDGGSVFLLAATNNTDRKANAQFFPASGGAQGTFIPRHPALRDFPHDGFCDLQFYHLITGSFFYTLDGAPRDLVPLVGGLGTGSLVAEQEEGLVEVRLRVRSAGRQRKTAGLQSAAGRGHYGGPAGSVFSL